MSYMIVPKNGIFTVVDDNTGELVGAYPNARLAAKRVSEGVLPSDTTYAKLMAAAKAQYDAEMKEIENMKAAKLAQKVLDKVLRANREV